MIVENNVGSCGPTCVGKYTQKEGNTKKKVIGRRDGVEEAPEKYLLSEFLSVGLILGPNAELGT